MYCLYILRCADGTLYTGIAVDVNRRVIEHNSSPRGAKYTRSRRPVVLVYIKKFRTRATAQRVEAGVKNLTRREKVRLIKTRPRRRPVHS